MSRCAGIACSATTRCGCRAPITRASRRRWWWSGSWRRRASTIAIWAARSSKSACGSGRSNTAARIRQQMMRLGASCDWSRERFTLDAGLSRAVREVFVRLYEKGLIYRGEYMVNWCPRLPDRDLRSGSGARGAAGHLWHIRYPVNGMPGRYRDGGDHAAGDDAGRYRGRDQPEGRAVSATCTARRCSCR